MANTYTVSNVNIGSIANDGTGDPIRTAFLKINQNFNNVYTLANLAYNGLGANGGGGGANSNYYYYSNANLVGYVTLTELNNELANIQPVNLSNLVAELANVQSVNLANLANALSYVQPVNLSLLNNALATVNVTSLTNFTNTFNSLTANAPAKVGIVSDLSANGTFEGQQVLNTADDGLYIWRSNAWLSPQAAYTPTASSISGVEVFNTFSLPLGPNDGNDFEGRQGFYNNQFYIYVNSAWSLYDAYIAGTGNVVLGANVVTAASIAVGAVVAGKIGAAAVNTAELAAGAVTANIIAANAIVAGKISAGAIGATEIAANAITAYAIAANAITTLALEANAITANKIAANAITAVQIAANAVYANAIQANSIDAAKIAANAITSVQIAANAVYAGALDAYAVTADKIAANAITSVKIAANAVYAGAIEAFAISADKIAANAITAGKVAANAIYANSILSNSITAAQIKANTITAAEILAGSITADKIDSRGLTIKDAGGNVLFGAGVISSNVVISTPGGGTTTLNALVTSSTNVIVSIGSASSEANANLYLAGTVYQNTTNGNSYIVVGNAPNARWQVFVAKGTDGQGKFLRLQSTSPGFGVKADGTSIGNVILTANTYGGLVNTSPTFSVTGGTATLSTHGDTNTRLLKFADMSSNSVIITATIVDSGTTYRDTTTLNKVFDGATTPQLILTKESLPLPSASDGTVSSYTGAASTYTLYLGFSDDSANWSWSKVDSTGLVSVLNTGTKTVTISSLGSSYDTGYVDLTATRSGYASITKRITVTKSKNGTNGTSGQRGTLQTAASGYSSWNSTAATNAITALGLGGPYTRDMVTLYNTSGFSETRFWDGSTWATIAAYIGGNMLVDGTIAATKIVAGSISATQIASGAITTSKISGSGINGSVIISGTLVLDSLASGTAYLSTGSFGFGSGTTLAGIPSVGAFNTTSAGTSALLVQSSVQQEALSVGSTYALGTPGTHAFSAAGFYKARGGAYNSGVGTPYTGYSLTALASETYGVVSQYYNSSGTVTAGCWLATYNGKSFYTVAGVAAPFTGAHDGLMNRSDTTAEYGDILIDVEVIAKKSVNDCITSVALSSAPNQKAVIGVLTYGGDDMVPTSLGEHNGDMSGNTIGMVLATEFADIFTTYKLVTVNSLGEGLINVCGEGGDIEVGDLISSSSIPGKGMKQSDDLVRNYTVAKSREAVTFSSPTEVKQIACSYHCG